MVEQRLFVGRDKLLYYEFQKYEVMAMSVVGGQPKKKSYTHITVKTQKTHRTNFSNL